MAERPTECPGDCCVVFSFPALMQRFPTHATQLSHIRALVFEGEYIGDMLVPLTIAEAEERSARLGNGGTGFTVPWTCRHFDETTKLCGAYDSRPHMCRDYPGLVPCAHGCAHALTGACGIRKGDGE